MYLRFGKAPFPRLSFLVSLSLLLLCWCGSATAADKPAAEDQAAAWQTSQAAA